MKSTVTPGWAARLVHWLVRDDYASDILTDLESDARRRLGRHARGPLLHGWYLSQCVSVSMLQLAWTVHRRSPRSPGLGFEGVWLDVRHASKSLVRDPLFTSAAVASLTLGIAATAAITSVTRAALLDPPPYEDADRLVYVWNELGGFDRNRLPLSGAQIAALRAESAVFDDVAGVWATSRTLTLDQGARLIPAGTVTPNFFRLLGVRPARGRTFADGEGTEDQPGVVVSHGFWINELGEDPNVLGRGLRLDGSSVEIIGVLPADFELVFPASVGVPPRLDVFSAYPWFAAENPEGPRFLRTVARVREGVPLERAAGTVVKVAADLRALHAHMAEADDRFSVAPLHADSTHEVRLPLLVLVAGVGLFLLLTGFNVAGLLIARAASRRSTELAVRIALGATRWRIGRRVLVEVVLLAVAGGVLGFGVAVLAVQGLWSFRPDGLARVREVAFDGWVIGTTFLAVSASLLVALVGPWLGSAWRAPANRLRGAVGASGRAMLARRTVIASEVALTVVLAVGGILLGRTFTNMQSVDVGFDPAGTTTFRVGLSPRAFPTDEERALLSQRIEEAIADLPGVTHVGATTHLPFAEWANWSDAAAPEAEAATEGQQYHFDHRAITPGYVEAVGAPVLAGRDFSVHDADTAATVVLVDQAYADRVFPAGNAVGSRIVPSRYTGGQFEATHATIVGVVGNVRDRDPARSSEGQIFWPFAQSARWELTYVVRTAFAPSSDFADNVREEITGVHPDLAVADVSTLASYLDRRLARTRFLALLGALFSGMAVIMAGLGLYGVVSYAAASRSREIGIRLALGAPNRDVVGLLLREGLTLAATGVPIGLMIAAVLSGPLGSLLYGVRPLEPVVYVVVAIIVGAMAVLASILPAWRSTRLDPLFALRAE